MLKIYKTNEAKWQMTSENITKQFKAEFMPNRQKGKNITKPIVAKPLTDFSKL
jgi:hypothetical protein